MNWHEAPRWRLDEIAHAGRENLDAHHVSHYDDKENAAPAEELALLLQRGLTSDAVVIDLGAGTGQFSLACARACRRVIAVDVSPVMLARLRSNIAAAGVDNVEVVQAGFLSYDHDGAPADVVYSRLALHHLPDFWKSVALHRIRQTLHPGGLLRLVDVVYPFRPAQAEQQVQAWSESLPEAGDADGEWVRADIDDHVRDEHSTYTWLLEPMIERSGFQIEHVTPQSENFLTGYIARAI